MPSPDDSIARGACIEGSPAPRQPQSEQYSPSRQFGACEAINLSRYLPTATQSPQPPPLPLAAQPPGGQRLTGQDERA